MNVTINTDASFCHRTKSAGYAVWISSNIGRIKYSGILKECKCSSEAEQQAIANALFLLRKSYLNNGNILRIYLNSDCIPALNMVVKKGGNKAGRYAYNQAKLILSGKVGGMSNFIKRHVKAHTNAKDARSWVNNWCDSEAKRWMRKQREAIKQASK